MPDAASEIPAGKGEAGLVAESLPFRKDRRDIWGFFSVVSRADLAPLAEGAWERILSSTPGIVYSDFIAEVRLSTEPLYVF